MKYLYRPNPDVVVGRPSVQGRPIISSDDFERLGAGLFHVEERHGLIKNIASDRIYLVLEGNGEFTVNGEQFAVTRGDVVLVPRNTPYDYQGRLKLFLVHSPANNDEADISLGEKPVPARTPDAPLAIL